MFSKSYQLLPQRDSAGPRTPGLFVDTDGLSQPGYHKGLSFDSMPNVSQTDFTGRHLNLPGNSLLMKHGHELIGFFSFRYLPGVAVLDLQSDCHLPRPYLHFNNISHQRMVCTEGQVE